jgi:stearoyl-CoA desaturase (delta-9 desaturase)
MSADVTVADRRRAESPARLPLPAHATPVRIDWVFAGGILGIHLIALLALVPYFFSWTGVLLVPLGYYVFGTLGINLCFHRLLTHRSFAVPLWLERTLAVLGVCAMEDTPAMWVANHRLHHQYSDEQPDPHSPLVSFLWGHLLWGAVRNNAFERLALFNRYARDVMRDPFYASLERYYFSRAIVFASWCAFFFGGFFAERLMGGTTAQAIQFGLSLLVWGVFVRTVATWHITWSINSVTHLWGYRTYETRDSSRNNWIIGLLANGEGWHNNHHAHPSSARHGHKWWELDIGWLTIRLLMMLGLATKVVLPPPSAAGARSNAA